MSVRKSENVSLNLSYKKFIFLSIITLGLYQVYWGWQVWETVRNSKNETYRFRSSLRALFLHFSGLSLFPQLQELAVEKGYKSGVGIKVIALLYLFAGLIAGIVPLVGIIALTLIPLPVVKMQNYYVEQTKGKFLPTGKNWWLIGALVGLPILSALMLLVAITH